MHILFYTTILFFEASVHTGQKFVARQLRTTAPSRSRPHVFRKFNNAFSQRKLERQRNSKYKRNMRTTKNQLYIILLLSDERLAYCRQRTMAWRDNCSATRRAQLMLTRGERTLTMLRPLMDAVTTTMMDRISRNQLTHQATEVCPLIQNMPEDKQNSPVDTIPPLQLRFYLRDLEDFRKLPEDHQGTTT